MISCSVNSATDLNYTDRGNTTRSQIMDSPRIVIEHLPKRKVETSLTAIDNNRFPPNLHQSSHYNSHRGPGVPNVKGITDKIRSLLLRTDVERVRWLSPQIDKDRDTCLSE